MNNENNNNKTQFIFNCKSPFLHYLLSILMFIMAMVLLVFSILLFQHKQNLTEENIKIQKQYLNDLKIIKTHKICKKYDNDFLEKLNENYKDYKDYSLKFDFNNSYFVENYNNLYLRYVGLISLKLPNDFNNFDKDLNNLLNNISEKFPGYLEFNNCDFNKENEIYCQVYLNFYDNKKICNNN